QYQILKGIERIEAQGGEVQHIESEAIIEGGRDLRGQLRSQGEAALLHYHVQVQGYEFGKASGMAPCARLKSLFQCIFFIQISTTTVIICALTLLIPIMAELVLSALLPIVFEKLTSVLKNKIARFNGIHSELKKWERSLSLIQELLKDASQKEVASKSVKQWLNDL
ncbi:NB-ARC domains-containing protein, partial [Tanacetum coccineum]